MNINFPSDFNFSESENAPFSDAAYMEWFTKEVASQTQLHPKEELSLVIKAKKNDSDALEKLIQSNLKLVLQLAKHYQNQGLTLKDLITEGKIGLLKSVDKFPDETDLPYRMYAIWWIRQTILQALAETSRQKRLKSNQSTNVAELTNLFNYLEEVLNREPTSKELAEASLAHSISLPHARLLSALNPVSGMSNQLDEKPVLWPASLESEKEKEKFLSYLNTNETEFTEQELWIVKTFISKSRAEVLKVSDEFMLTEEDSVAIIRKIFRKIRHFYRYSKTSE